MSTSRLPSLSLRRKTMMIIMTMKGRKEDPNDAFVVFTTCGFLSVLLYWNPYNTERQVSLISFFSWRNLPASGTLIHVFKATQTHVEEFHVFSTTSITSYKKSLGLPGESVVESACQCRATGGSPSRKIPPAKEQLRLYATVDLEPQPLSPGAATAEISARSPQAPGQEKPPPWEASTLQLESGSHYGT